MLLVSHQVAVGESTDAIWRGKGTMPRLDVFQLIDGKWRWIAHANIRPLGGPAKQQPDERRSSP